MSTTPIVYGPARVLPGKQIQITTNPDTASLWQVAKNHRPSCGAFASRLRLSRTRMLQQGRQLADAARHQFRIQLHHL